MTVRTHAQKRDDARLVTPHLASEPCASGDELRRRQFIGAGRGPADEVGESITEAGKGVFLRRVEKPRRESGAVQRGPEAVAGSGEVIAGRGGVEAGVDAAEEYGKTGRDDIAQSLVPRRCEICRARPGE